MLDALVPPHDLVAEQIVIGFALISGSDARAVIRRCSLDPADFYEDTHRHVWAAVVAVTVGSDGGVDIESVVAEMRTAGTWDSGAGRKLMTGCLTASGDPQRVRYDLLERHAERVRGAATLRRIGGICKEIAHAAYTEPGDVVDFCRDVQRRVSGAAVMRGGGLDVITHSRAIEGVMQSLQRASEGDVETTLLPTGIRALDAVIGGLPIGQTTILGARPGTGKSTLAEEITRGMAANGTVVLVVALEDTAEVWACRAIAAASGVNAEDIRRRSVQRFGHGEWARMSGGVGREMNLPISYRKRRSGTLSEIVDQMYALRGENPDANIAVVVDYVQKVRLTGRDKQESRVEDIGHAARTLDEVAADIHAGHLLVSQLNRDLGKDGEPSMVNQKGSGTLEEICRLGMLLWDPWAYGKREIDMPSASGGMRSVGTEGRVIVKVDKNNHGSVGTVMLDFERSFTRFSSMQEAG